jgi:hypothetical protein
MNPPPVGRRLDTLSVNVFAGVHNMPLLGSLSRLALAPILSKGPEEIEPCDYTVGGKQKKAILGGHAVV